MKQIAFIFFSLIILSLTACSVSRNTMWATDEAIVDWGSSAGISRLEESKYKIDFFKLANHFESQNNKIFCGPASAAIVLNSLRVRNGNIQLPEDKSLLRPADLQYFSSKTWSPVFSRYTQNNIFLSSPKSREQVLGENQRDKQGIVIINDKGKPQKDRGFQLHQLGELFKAHGLKTQVRVVDKSLDIETIKQEIIANLGTAGNYVVINYKRRILQQPGGGHISPLGAYHKASDSFLVMDVTPNKADWVWVKAELLFSAMRTFDTLENRGYILISEGLR